MALKNSVLSALNNNKGSYISGEQLSTDMGVSRTAVWKAINALRDDGHIIEAVTNKGYKLADINGSLTEMSVRASLHPKHRKIDIHVFDSIGSTNTYAKQLAVKGAPHGTVVLSQTQTDGRGRLGRSFHSPKSGIYLSIIIKPDFDLTGAGLVTTAAATAVVCAIEDVCGLDAGIKWVNDIYINDKKVCGILSEGVTDFETGHIESIIIGIGINTDVGDFPEELLSIAGAVEGDYSKSALAAEVISRTLDLMNDLDDRSFIEIYRNRSIVIGKNITVYKGIYKTSPNEVPSRPARVLDIDDDGGLLVIYSNGERETLTSGEISIRL